MATHAITEPVARRHVPRTMVFAFLIAATLAVGVGIERATSPAPEIRWHPTTTLTVPWRSDWINAVNRMERQQSRDEPPDRRG
jgi:hypothetical protein